jgi:Large polyvalent protein associated domain 38
LRSAMALNRIYSKINTSWVPDFFLVHFPRTLEDALLAAGAEKKGLMTGIMKEMPNAAKIIAKEMAGIPLKPSEARLYNEWRTSGAKFDYGGFETIARMSKKIEKEMRGLTEDNKMSAKKAARSMVEMGQLTLSAIEHLNQFFEHIVRFATFSALRKGGMETTRAAALAGKGASLKEAAQLTRDYPVDYRKQGAFMPYINAARPFTSVTVGTARTFYRVLASKAGRRMLMGITALSALNSLLGLMVSDKDKVDPTKSDFYTGIRGSERQKNVVFPLKNKDGEYLKLAMGFLFIPSWVLGDQIVGVATGQVKPSDAAVNVISSLATAYDQIPNFFGEKSLIHQLAPMGVDGLLDTYYNRNMFGTPIYPEPQQGRDALPHSEQSFRSTSEGSKELAKDMNSLTGGNAYKKGMIDVYQGNIDYWVNYITGVSGTFAKDTWGAISNAVNGLETPYEKMPFVRRLVTNPAGVQEGQYYDIRNDILNKQKVFDQAYKDYQDDRTNTAARDTYNELKKELHMAATGTKAPQFSLPSIIKKSDEKINDLKDQIDDVQSNNSLSAADKANQVNALKQKITDQMTQTRKIIASKTQK